MLRRNVPHPSSGYKSTAAWKIWYGHRERNYRDMVPEGTNNSKEIGERIWGLFQGKSPSLNTCENKKK
jgi:hypothetical protein